MSSYPDRLYDLLPVIYRQRDSDRGYPLRDLLRVIAEQVSVVEADIDQLNDNWFIETCQDWVVPYLGDLIGYRTVHEAGEPGDLNTLQGQQRNKILIPRREVANTIRYRRRKGTLALLEVLAQDVAGWSVRAVEFYKLLVWTQSLNHPRFTEGRTVDLRQKNQLDLVNTPFDNLAHTIDIRAIDASPNQGLYNIPSVGIFVWRLQSYSVTQTPAYCVEDVSPHCYTFSILGNDTPLYNNPQPESDPTHIADEINLPTAIRRQAFEMDKQKFLALYQQNPTTPYDSLYYGEQKSFQLWVGDTQRSPITLQPIPLERVIPADLSDWHYRTPTGKVAIDPVLGRIAFPPRQLPRGGVWVSYHYGFSANVGGGEYDRPISQPVRHTLYQVVKQVTKPREFSTIKAALTAWQTEQEQAAGELQQAETNQPLDTLRIEQLHLKLEQLRHAVIEITYSGVFTEQLDIRLEPNQALQIRAANHKRPIIRLLDYQAETADALRITVQSGNRVTLDGLLIMGRSVQIQGEIPDFLENEPEVSSTATEPARVTIRHSTLVPGWALHCDCESKRPAEPSLELFNINAQVNIEHSIVGTILVNQDTIQTDPLALQISDSIVDGADPGCEAIAAPDSPVAHTRLTILRSTVFGPVQVDSIDLAENCIFTNPLLIARRQHGCVRFCYVPPGSRTPRRYHCQPDLAEQAIAAESRQTALLTGTSPPTSEAIELAQQQERDRVLPQFNSTRYGKPAYCQLADTCAEEIKRGADDESEMGVFHDLYQPQRAANLRVRLNEYTPADMAVGIIYVS